nr:pre-mRNA splicing Prp18-interacting factor [Tanacetum cinerariifolium]
MSTFLLCVGCGEPLYGFSPCRWCKCERCGIDLLNGICLLCHSSNSCTYDHNPNSFDCPPDSYYPPHPTYETYSGDSCGNDSHFGYDCPPQFPLNYEPVPGYIQNYNSYPHDSPSLPQQYPCCEDCEVTHEPYQCQPINHDYYHKQNSCYDSTSIGFDQSQPQQYTVNHPIFNAHYDLLGSQKKLNITLTKVNEQMTSLTSMCELACQIFQKNLEEKQLEEEQAAKAQNWKLPVCYDDDDDEESSNSLADNIILNFLSTKSDEFIKSCVENLVPNPSESEGENECDVPARFTTFSNVLFDDDYDFDSGDDQSFYDEDFPKKIYSNPLFDEEINPMKIDQHPFNAESDLIGSMPNHDSSITISSKIDSLFDEFAGELTLLKSIPSGIDETDCHPEKETRFAKRLLYDNSSPRPPEEILSGNSNADIESFSPSHIHNEDSNSHMEEIDFPFTSDDPMPPGIEDDDYDSGRDIPILEELLDNYSLSLSTNESYHFDIPSPYRPPAKPPDGNTGTLNIKMMGDVSDQKVPIPELMITRILNQEISPDLLSHQGLEAFQHSAECLMIINGKNIPLLDVPLFHFYPP